MFEKLFKFPILQVDGEEEDRKRAQAEEDKFVTGKRPEEIELDLIIGEAEVPYELFLCVTDRWMPTEESRERAKEGVFDACFVTFDAVGSYLVPWNKDKFKKKLKEFSENVPKPPADIQVMSFKDLLNRVKNENNVRDREDEYPENDR